MNKHVLSVLVENRPGVLSKVVGLFSRRGFNIDSLAVGVTQSPDISRITILVFGDEQLVEQISKQLNKLVDVIKIRTFSESDCVNRELILIKIKAGKSVRQEVIQLATIFRANIIDVSASTLTIELTGDTDKINAFLQMMGSYGIAEIARGGTLSLERGAHSL